MFQQARGTDSAKENPMAHVEPFPPTVEPPPAVAGAKSSAKQMVAAVARYAGARAQLAALEAKIAVGEIKTGLIMMGAAGVVLIVALAVIVAGLIKLVAWFLPHGNGSAACGIVAAVLILVAFLMLRKGKSSMKGKNFFPVTRAELHTDKQCLKNH
jgi:uncharacterized membrane protein YqjE